MEFRRIATSAAVLLGLQLFLPAPAQAEQHKLPAEASVQREGGEVPEPISLSPARESLGSSRRRSFVTNVYNGMYIPPVLRLKRGDELQLKLVNETGRGGLEIEKPR